MSFFDRRPNPIDRLNFYDNLKGPSHCPECGRHSAIYVERWAMICVDCQKEGVATGEKRPLDA